MALSMIGFTILFFKVNLGPNAGEAVALKTYGVQGDLCHAQVDAYLKNLYDSENVLKQKRTQYV